MARQLKVEIIGDASSLQRALRSADNSGRSFGSRLASVGKIAAAGFAGGIAVGTIALKKSFDAAVEAEKSETRLNTAFKAIGATARDRAVAMEQVSKVSRQSGLDDEALIDTLARLSRVTGDAADAQKLMGTAADIARARGIELEAATSIVTKASLGQLGALKRIGIEIPKVTTAQDALKMSNEKATVAQKAAAKAADETATRQSALAALQKQYSGAAKEYGDTTAGAQEKFRVATENLQEAIGERLLPVFARFAEFLVANMPAIERVVTQVTGAIGAAFQTLARIAETAWPRIRAAIAAVTNWYENHVQPTFESVTRNIGRVWDQEGKGIQDSTNRNFGSLPPLVKMLLQNTLSIVNASLAVLRGDWQTAWNELKVIPGRALQAVYDTVVMIKDRIRGAALALGNAVVAGVAAGLSALAGVVSAKLGGIATAVAGAAASAYSAATRIGTQIVSGVLDGLAGLYNAVKNKIEGILGSVLSAIDIPGFSPVAHAAQKAIGEPIVKGAIAGLEALSASFTAKTSEVVRRAVEGAVDAVKESRGSFADAMASWGDAALAAFDKVTSQHKTKTEKLLAQMDIRERVKSLKDAIAEASGGVSAARVEVETATASGDPAAIAAATQKLIDAEKQKAEALAALNRYNLEQRAVAERVAYEKRREQERVNFEQGLIELQARLRKQVEAHKLSQNEITALLASYLDKYKLKGQQLGAALARGLRDSAGGVVDAANELAAAIAKALGVAAEVGKKAAVTAGSRLQEVERRAVGGPVRAGTPYIVGERGPEVFWPGLSGSVIPNSNTLGAANVAGGGITVNVYGSVTSERDLAETLRVELLNIGRYNAGGVLGGTA